MNQLHKLSSLYVQLGDDLPSTVECHLVSRGRLLPNPVFRPKLTNTTAISLSLTCQQSLSDFGTSKKILCFHYYLNSCFIAWGQKNSLNKSVSLCVCLFVDRVSLHNPGWPWTCHPPGASFPLRSLPHPSLCPFTLPSPFTNRPKTLCMF